MSRLSTSSYVGFLSSALFKRSSPPDEMFPLPSFLLSFLQIIYFVKLDRGSIRSLTPTPTPTPKRYGLLITLSLIMMDYLMSLILLKTW